MKNDLNNPKQQKQIKSVISDSRMELERINHMG